MIYINGEDSWCCIPPAMDDYNRFRELASSPFSCQSLRLLQAAVQIIRSRYPNFLDTLGPPDGFVFPPYDAFNVLSSGLAIDRRWADYVGGISLQEEPREGDEITPVQWRLSRGDHLHPSIIEDYLQLLRDKGSSISILEPRILSDNIEELVAGQNERPAIIPLIKRGQWSFMVVYPDCIHYFDSRRDTPILRCSTLPIKHWTGPKQDRSEDSGVFMLLGIRLLVEGTAHVDQKEGEEIITKFRSMVLVELLSKKLNPKPGDFEQLLPGLDEESSFFGREAWSLQTPAPTVETLASEVDSTPAEFVQDPAEPNGVLTPRSLPRAAPDTPPDDRRTILTVLSNAVLASRSTKMTAATPFEILCAIVKTEKWSSEFHTRYNGVLLYERMQQRPETSLKKRISSRFRFWNKLCSLYPVQGLARYALLCAIPEGFNAAKMTAAVQGAKIAEIQRRLEDPNDRLREDLAKVKDLCEAIINSSLPNEILMIDLYKQREQEVLTNECYDVFVSMNPRVQIRIPRAL